MEDEQCQNLIAEKDLCLIFLCGNQLTSVPHQIGFQRLELSSYNLSIALNYYIWFIFRMTPSCLSHPPSLSEPERVLDFDGHVIGLSLSPDSRYLYVNVRTWPPGAVVSMEQPPPISSQIEMHVVDMTTLQKTGQVSI